MSEHLVERGLAFNAVGYHTDQKTVPQGLQSFVLARQFVGGGDKDLHRQSHRYGPILENPLVYGGQQGILNRRAGLPYLVQENDISSRQIPVCAALVAVLVLEFSDGHRAENLIGSREPGHQVLKRRASGEYLLQPSGNHALACARRPQ